MLADVILLKSENKPITNIQAPKILNIINPSKKNNEQINKMIPPHKGGFFEIEKINFLCFEWLISSNRIFFFSKIYLKKKLTKIHMIEEKIKILKEIINIFF